MTAPARTQAGPGAMARPEAERNTNGALKVAEADDPHQPLRIRRGAQVEIRLSLREHHGREFLDLRSWFGTEEGEWLPSRRGFTVPPAMWSDFFEIVVEMDRRLRAAGIVAEEQEGGDDGTR